MVTVANDDDRRSVQQLRTPNFMQYGKEEE